MKIVEVTGDTIDIVWPIVSRNVQKVLDTQHKHKAVTKDIYDVDGTLEHLKSGNGLLLVIYDETTNNYIVASIVVEVLNTDVGRSLNLTTLGGDRIYEWHHLLLDYLKTLAVENNCQDIRIYMVRKGWAKCLKPYGFKPIGKHKYAGVLYPVIALGVN